MEYELVFATDYPAKIVFFTNERKKVHFFTKRVGSLRYRLHKQQYEKKIYSIIYRLQYG